MPTSPSSALIAFDPGLNYFKASNVATWSSVSSVPCEVFAYTFRNASTSPVFVNFYELGGTVTVGGGSASAPIFREMVPGAIDASNPGMLKIVADNFPIRSFAGALSFAPVLTDSDTAALGGTLSYVEIQWATNAQQQ